MKTATQTPENNNSDNGQSENAPTPPETPSQTNPEGTPPRPVEREIIEIPEGEEFFVGSDKDTEPRLTGLFPATVVALKQKPAPGVKGQGARLIFDFRLKVPNPKGTAVHCQYECSQTWKPNSELQQVTESILGRPLVGTEMTKKFPVTQLRGRSCQVFVTEHRSRPKNGGPSTSRLVIGHIHPDGVTIEEPAERQLARA